MSARRSWHGGSIPLPLRAHRVDEFQSAQISLRRTCDRWSRLFASSWFQSSDVDLPNLFSLPLCWGECLVVMALVFFSLEAVVFALMTSPAHGQSDPRNPPLCRWAALAAQPCHLVHPVLSFISLTVERQLAADHRHSSYRLSAAVITADWRPARGVAHANAGQHVSRRPRPFRERRPAQRNYPERTASIWGAVAPCLTSRCRQSRP
jgi:hypothetical protein